MFDKRRAYKHSLTPEERVKAEADLKLAEAQAHQHRVRATASRLGYYGRRAKAVQEEFVRKGYLSLVIDGAGAQASNYCPRYSTSEKGEPARHKMLKIKSTYVKVLDIAPNSLYNNDQLFIYFQGTWRRWVSAHKFSRS